VRTHNSGTLATSAEAFRTISVGSLQFDRGAMIRALLVAAAIATATIGAAPLAGAAPTPSPSPRPSSALGPPYANCTAAAAAGKTNITIGDPAYNPDWDHDGDGIACESFDDSE
jgi:hypothetical protein